MHSYTTEHFKRDVTEAKTLQKKHGTSYYFATSFMPKKLRDATYTLYAFFRIPDEIVDNAETDSSDDVLEQLTTWQRAWYTAYTERKSNNPILRATQYVFHLYNIPFSLSEDFLSAMIQDVHKKSYQNYSELEAYMYGSASVVGIMLSYVIGFKNEKTLTYAKKLGEAMQLTNFLRDVGEDFQKRGRIYMPQDELHTFGITDEIQTQKVSENWKRFMQFQIARARSLYREAEPGIQELSHEGRLAVRLASRLYAQILDKIEEVDYDCLHMRVRTSTLEKIQLAIPISLRHISYYE